MTGSSTKVGAEGENGPPKGITVSLKRKKTTTAGGEREVVSAGGKNSIRRSKKMIQRKGMGMSVTIKGGDEILKKEGARARLRREGRGRTVTSGVARKRVEEKGTRNRGGGI